ncbi:Sensor histidine kinase YesM [Lachnospiraceae bacterium C7]|nr:Sensor histidine kinase YesM [Lachnospiraceae bacterium C7]
MQEIDLYFLLIDSIRELLVYGLYATIIVVIAFLVKKYKIASNNKNKTLVAAFVMLITTLGAIIYVDSYGVRSETLLSLALAFTMAAELYILQILDYEWLDYYFIFLTLIIPQRLFNSGDTLFGIMIFFVIVMCIVSLFTKIRFGHLRGRVVSTFVEYTYLALTLYVFKWFENRIYYIFRYKYSSSKLVLIVFVGMMIFLLLEVTYLVSNKMKKLIYLMHSILEMEKESRQTYYKRIEENLINMKKIRHDIKNVFFTMGSFVEKSGDEEMKKYFWENIYPFASTEIDKNYALSKIMKIPSEQLRALLQVKITEIIQLKIKFELDIVVDENSDIGMEILDISRILGILLDNAIEATKSQDDGKIIIVIRCKTSGSSYIIKNTITDEMRKNKSIQKGVSTKENHDGLGLIVVDKIVAKYPSANLNSIFNKELFIQSLYILKE